MTKKPKRQEQPHLPAAGMAPADPHPELKEAVDEWLLARDEQRGASETTKKCHDAMIGTMGRLGVERYTYVDSHSGKKKHVLADKTPRAKVIAAPAENLKGRRGRERDVETGDPATDAAIGSVLDAVDDIFGGDIKSSVSVSVGGKHVGKIESRRVSRKSVESEIDPFAATRARLDEASKPNGAH